MTPKEYFKAPTSPAMRRYEAFKAFYQDGLSAKQAATKFNFSPTYFKKLRFQFANDLHKGVDPFFPPLKPGPKNRSTDERTVEQIKMLRKRNYSINDIQVSLDAEGTAISLDTIDKILKDEGFSPLPKRTRKERLSVGLPEKLETVRSVALEIKNEEFTTEFGAGPLIFMPILENLGVVDAIRDSMFPGTKDIDGLQSVLSFLCLKLMGGTRWSYDTKWNMDRALGLFAGLNVLPKATTLSTYSYRVTRADNLRLLIKLSKIFEEEDIEEGEFNLDFKAIPHWGGDAILEKNWCGARSKAMRSVLALFVQDPSTGNLSYTDAEIRHRNQNEAVLEFVDFWKEGRGVAPKMLIFDSKFTTYGNLNKLDKSEDKINFLTIRRRGKEMIERVEKISEENWSKIKVKRAKGREQQISVLEEESNLTDYVGKVRQIVIKDHGRQKPTFLITNDFEMNVKGVVEKYARRWLVEQEIAEHVSFFNLNSPSSSIVIKVDFDLTISLLAHNLYRKLAEHLPGFENCTAPTIFRKFLENGARMEIENGEVTIRLKKKTHLPILFEAPWMRQSTRLSWLNVKVNYVAGVVS